ncbi:MAG: alpha/beta hydrolase [Chloroflexi bacterium]|nr:alpha/beta hydrolase [Chloroflexota bacterium]
MLIEMGDWSLYCEEKGEGKPILFLHGTPTSSFLWRNQIDALAKHYRVYAIDLPGWARSGKPENFDYKLESYAEIVKQFLDKIGERKVILGIHDLGAAIGMTFYGRYPEMVSKLILFDTFAYLPFTRRLGWQALYHCLCGIPLAGGRFHRLLWFFSVKKSDVFASLAFYNKRLATKELVAAYRDLAVNSQIADYKTFTANGMDSIWGAVEENSFKVSVPTLILWAENDMLFPTSAARKLHQDIKASVLKTIPQCGHWLQEEKPDEVNSRILEFLRS